MPIHCMAASAELLTESLSQRGHPSVNSVVLFIPMPLNQVEKCFLCSINASV